MTSARCVDRCRDQPLLGSASTSHWLLVVDQPRPWQSKIQNSLQLAPNWQALCDRWRAEGTPFSLLARSSSQGQVHLFGWHEGVVQQWSAPGGQARAVSPRLLVCTHGSRDACCGSLGVRLAQRLRADLGEVWEVSHLGGHRFAPTLWHLPSWRVYGRLPLEPESGNWEQLRYLRGNAAYSPNLQVLEAHLWEQRQEWPRWIREHEQGYRVLWPDGRDELWTAQLRSRSHRGPLSCRDIPQDVSEGYTSYEVVDSALIGTVS